MKRQREKVRGFTKEQNKYLQTAIQELFNALEGYGNPECIILFLTNVLKQKNYDQLKSFLKHEKFSSRPEFCGQALLLHEWLYNASKTQLFENLPTDDSDDGLTAAKIELFQFDLNEKIKCTRKVYAKCATSELTSEQMTYFRRDAIKPYIDQIYQEMTFDFETRAFVLNLMLTEDLTHKDFIHQLATKLSRLPGNKNADKLKKEIVEHCTKFWNGKGIDEPSALMTQPLCELTIAACALFMLLKSPNKNIWVKKCPLLNADGSGLSVAQTKALRALTRHKLEKLLTALQNPKLVSVEQWNSLKQKLKNAQDIVELNKIPLPTKIRFTLGPQGERVTALMKENTELKNKITQFECAEGKRLREEKACEQEPTEMSTKAMNVMNTMRDKIMALEAENQRLMMADVDSDRIEEDCSDESFLYSASSDEESALPRNSKSPKLEDGSDWFANL